MSVAGDVSARCIRWLSRQAELRAAEVHLKKNGPWAMLSAGRVAEELDRTGIDHAPQPISLVFRFP
jgi:hypothetical protein